MEVLIFFIAIIAAAFAWERVAKKLGAKGKGFFLRHLAGFATFFITACICMIVATIIFPDLGKSENQSNDPQTTPVNKPVQASAPVPASNSIAASESTQVDSKPVATSEVTPAEPIKPSVATLSLNFETWKNRVNADFQAADLPFEISDSIRPEKSSDSDVRKVAISKLSETLAVTIAVDPATDKITSVSVMMQPSADGLANIQNGGGAAIMLAAVAGDNGEKTVGGKIVKMLSSTIERFSKKPNDEDAGKNKFIENGVKYGVLVSKVMPIMLYAEPNQDTPKSKGNHK